MGWPGVPMVLGEAHWLPVGMLVGGVGRSSLVMEKKQCVGDRGKRSFVFKYAELEELMKNIRKFYRL